MIIACPACTTRYVVPDTAIGPEGRMVRCAKCRNSWFQDAGPLPADPAREAAMAEAEVAPPATPTPAPATSPAPAREPEPEPAIMADTAAPAPPPPAPPPPLRPPSFAPARQGRAIRDAAPPFPRHRNPLRLWSWAAGIFALLALGAIAAISSWGLPAWVPMARPTFAVAQPELQLDFPLDQQERRQLPNGTEYFGASGTITNTGSQARSVPPVLIVLRDARERIVYSWEVIPPKRSLAPGESISINEAVTDVPRSARVAEIGWKPG